MLLSKIYYQVSSRNEDVSGKKFYILLFFYLAPASTAYTEFQLKTHS